MYSATRNKCDGQHSSDSNCYISSSRYWQFVSVCSATSQINYCSLLGCNFIVSVQLLCSFISVTEMPPRLAQVSREWRQLTNDPNAYAAFSSLLLRLRTRWEVLCVNKFGKVQPEVLLFIISAPLDHILL